MLFRQFWQYAEPMNRTTLLIAVLLLALARSAHADFVFNYNTGFQNGGIIPDGSLTGWTDTRAVSTPGFDHITDLSVSLSLSGGWNGDLYAYLVHSSGFAVLLNRVGRGNGGAYNSSGYGASGMNVVLNDAGLLNIHNVPVPGTGAIPLTFQPDGRNINPLSSPATFSGTLPTALLSSFNGVDPNGSWTLFIADVSPGDQSTITHWDLDIAAVPEPASLVEGSIAVLFLGGVIGLYRLKGPKTQPQPC